MTEGVSPSIFETLRQLGLTEYGARCYVALLALKSGEAAAIAEAAVVPRTKVYATLKDLADDGWIIAGSGRPVIYTAVAPEDRIASAEKKITQGISDTTRELQARHQLGAQMLPVSMYMLRGKAAIEAKTLELISRARTDLFVNLGFMFDGEARAVRDALEAAQRRGVVVKLMLGPGVDADELGPLGKDARPAIFPFHGVICDWRQAFIVLPGAEPVGLWNPTQAFVETLKPVIVGAWDASEPS